MSTRIISYIEMILVSVAVVQPVMAESQGQQRKHQILNAYKNIHTYQAAINYQRYEKRGRWEYVQRTTFRIAFDRSNGRLMLDKSGDYLVIDGPKLRMRRERFKGRHLELDTPKPLSYRSLRRAIPLVVGRPELPDLMLLLGEDPSASEPNMQVEVLEPETNDPNKRGGILLAGQRFNLVLRCNPKTHLAEVAILYLNPKVLGRSSDNLVQIAYEIQIEKHNTELPQDTFAFETIGSKAVKSLAELAGRHRLEGKPALPINLTQLDGQPFQLSSIKARISLICFWASWYPAHHRELAAAQEMQKWAAQTNQPMAVFTVNLKDTADKVKHRVAELGLKLPVLLAVDDKVAIAYDASELPRTVLIVDGRIEKMLKLISGNEAALQQKIERLLAEQPSTQPEN